MQPSGTPRPAAMEAEGSVVGRRSQDASTIRCNRLGIFSTSRTCTGFVTALPGHAAVDPTARHPKAPLPAPRRWFRVREASRRVVAARMCRSSPLPGSILYRPLTRPVQTPVSRGRSYSKLFALAPLTWLQRRIPYSSQFTNRRMRMFITMPSARNVNNTDEPP